MEKFCQMNLRNKGVSAATVDGSSAKREPKRKRDFLLQVALDCRICSPAEIPEPAPQLKQQKKNIQP